MEILKVVERLEDYSRKIFAVMVDEEFTETMSEAASLLVGQGEKIADLENTVTQQRKRASDAEDFICMLCTECDWERDGDVIIMSKHCCEFGMPECGKFKLRGTDPGRWIPVTERLPEEHESIFARFYGTKNWMPGMFCTVSDTVIAAVLYEDGKRTVKAMHTQDGKWHHPGMVGIKEVTHWMPLPEPPKEVTR